MLQQSKGKIFLSGERGHTETDWFRSYNTFNFGQYQSEHKQPFGPLYVMNDDTLAGKRAFKLLVEEDTQLIVLPVVGSVAYNDSNNHHTTVQAGQIQYSAAPKNTTIELGNPYDDELINFLQIWIKHPAEANNEPTTFSFDLNANKNKLITLFDESATLKATFSKLFIGKYSGRAEAIHTLTNENNGLFVLVLEGAFEVQNRLLETRDGLALWEVAEIEMEALSNDAIVLLIEVPMNKK